MNRIILDTEFVNLGKPFVYNLGYVIVNEEGKTIIERDFVIKQIWYNKPLFATAYFSNKKNIYISKMRGRKMNLVYWGECVRTMIKDIKTYGIKELWAYNCKADYQAIKFMCDWFKTTLNPLELVDTLDIWAFARNVFLKNNDYVDFCQKANYVNKRGVKCTAESVFAYITQNPNYEEEHTALSDSKIEEKILFYMLKESEKSSNYRFYGGLWRKEG